METQAAEISSLPDVAKVDSDANDGTVDGSAPSGVETTAAKDQSSPDKKRDEVNERFDKLTRDLYELRGDRDRDRYDLGARDKRIAELEAQLATAKPSQTATDTFPTLEEHGYDEGKFQAAVAQHIAKVTREQGTAAAQEVIRAEREAEAARRTGETWATKEAEFIKSKPDYVEKVQQARTLPITEQLQQILKGHDLGPQIAYQLVENREQALAIARMPLATQLIEVGRIAERLAAAKVAKPAVSQAPPPTPKVDGTAAQVDKDPAEMSDAEFNKWRKRQIAQRRNS